MEAVANYVGETNSTGCLLIPLDKSSYKDTSEMGDDLWNITTSRGTKWGYAMIEVPPGTCPSLNINMAY